MKMLEKREPNRIEKLRLISLAKLFNATRSLLAAAITVSLFVLSTSCGQGEGEGKGEGIGKGGSFSADMIVTLPSGMKMMESKIYVTPEASRMDWKQGKTNLSSIRKERENKEYLYNHDKKLYYEIDLNEEEELSSFVSAVSDYEVIEVMGKEKLDGFNCTKKRVKSSAEIMGMDLTTEMVIWEAEGIGIPIRSEGEEGNVMELKNISTKKPSSKLFELPTGYKKAKSLMDVMGFGFDMDDFDFSDYDSGLDGEGDEVTAAELREMIEQYKKSNDPDAQWMVEHLEIMLSAREALEAGGREDAEELLELFDNDGEKDIDKMFEYLKKRTASLESDPDEREKMMEALDQAKEDVKGMNFEEGAAEDIWKIIPKRPGDKLMDEFSIEGAYGVHMDAYGVRMETNSTMGEITSYYENELKSKGWKVKANAVFDGEGMVMLESKDKRMTLSSGDIDKNKKLKYYSIQVSNVIE